MLRVLARQLAQVAVAMLAVVSVEVGLPHQHAAVSLDETPDVVNVVTVYPTDSATQSEVLSAVSKAEASTFSEVPGFNDSAILKAQDSNQIIALSQWNGKDITSFESYAKEHVLSIPAGQSAQSFACQVQHTETRSASPKFQ